MDPVPAIYRFPAALCQFLPQDSAPWTMIVTEFNQLAFSPYHPPQLPPCDSSGVYTVNAVGR